MFVGYTADDLLTSVKTSAMMPASQLALQDVDILRFATEELRSWLFPLLLDYDDKAYLTSQDYALTSARKYRLPKRTAANTAYKVSYLDPNGLERGLTMFEPSELQTNEGYSIQGPYIVLTQNAPISGTMRVYYNMNPNELALLASCAQSSVGTATSVNSAQGAILFLAGTNVDIVKANPPFDVIATDLQILSVVGNVINFSVNLPADFESGDFLCLSGQSPFPQLPAALHAMLIRKATLRCLEALEDVDGVKMLEQRINAELPEILSRCAPRVKAEEKVISNTELTWGA